LDVVAALLLPLAAAAPVTTAIPAAAPPGGGLAMLVITAGEVVAAVVALRGMAPVLVAVPFICFRFLFFSLSSFLLDYPRPFMPIVALGYSTSTLE